MRSESSIQSPANVNGDEFYYGPLNLIGGTVEFSADDHQFAGRRNSGSLNDNVMMATLGFHVIKVELKKLEQLIFSS